MSSKRIILGTLITVGTLAMGASTLQANGSGDHDRRPLTNYVIQQEAPDSSDVQTTTTYTQVKKPVLRDMESYERKH